MKGFLVGLVAGVALAAGAGAQALTADRPSFTYHGVLCVFKHDIVACGPRGGFTVGVSRQLVAVTNPAGRVILLRAQP